MEDAIKIIRSILISSPNLLVDEIVREYKEMTGESIPFKDFGSNSLIEFLRSSNQFVGRKSAEGIRVSSKVSEDSAHIIGMVRGQNVSAAEKKRRKKTKAKNHRNIMNHPPMKSTSNLPQSKGGIRKGVVMKKYEPPAPKQIFQQPQIVSKQPAVVKQSQTIVKSSQNINLHSRLVPKQIEPKSVQRDPIQRPLKTRVNLIERLTAKQPVDCVKSEPPVGRAALLKIYENRRLMPSSVNAINDESKNEIKTTEKSCVQLPKPDLYSRLPQKSTLVDDSAKKLSHSTLSRNRFLEALNRTKKCDIELERINESVSTSMLWFALNQQIVIFMLIFS